MPQHTRLLFDIPLQVVSGSRFQPTGFPDIGAAVFRRPVRTASGIESADCLLVESEQSMANRLEAVAWDAAAQQPARAIADLPYVRVVRENGEFLTSSRLEAHRLASAFVKDSSLGTDNMVDVIRQRLGLADDTPLSLPKVAGAIFAMDPLCLIHGVFFADSRWPGQPKVARALTGFVEAAYVERVEAGGVKKDHVRHSIQDGKGTSEGYGTVPFHRTEWTAADITASFSLDRRQLTSYGLGDDAVLLLESIALWQIRNVLEQGLRLRTACDLAPVNDDFADRHGEPLPSMEELERRIAKGAEACSDAMGDVLTVVWNGGKKPKAVSS